MPLSQSTWYAPVSQVPPESVVAAISMIVVDIAVKSALVTAAAARIKLADEPAVLVVLVVVVVIMVVLGLVLAREPPVADVTAHLVLRPCTARTLHGDHQILAPDKTCVPYHTRSTSTSNIICRTNPNICSQHALERGPKGRRRAPPKAIA